MGEGACVDEPEPFLASMDLGPEGLDDGESDEPIPVDPEEHEGLAIALSEAVEVCKRCPVLDECREYALSEGEEYGVWGGLLPEERADIVRLAKRAARRARQESKRE